MIFLILERFSRSPLHLLTLAESIQMINALLTPQDQFHIKQYNTKPPSWKKHIQSKHQLPFLSKAVCLEEGFGETEEEFDLLKVG